MSIVSTKWMGLAAAGVLLGACAAPASRIAPAGEPALREVFEGDFLIGASLNEAQVTGEDPRGAALVRKHFNTVTAENLLKWEEVHPEPARYNFGPADAFVRFGEDNGQFIVGHTLVWHNQTPDWVFEDEAGNPASREVLLERMRDHIHTVVGRYRGRIHGWDVVNEALNEDGTLRESAWLRIIGEDYIAKAFQFAHEADPTAELYYNDYSLENAPKREGAIRLIRSLQAQGAPVHGIGTQQHVKMDWPSVAQVDSTLTAFGQLGVKVMVTELDVDVLPRATRSQGAEVTLSAAAADSLDPYREGLPEAMQQALAQRYAELFRVYGKHRDTLDRVTFWNVTDADSWLNYWPIQGRTAYPLLFDREWKPKPAFHAVVEVAREDEVGRE